MTVPPVTTTADRLPHALDAPEVAERLDGRRPAVFLDYDGVLTPIVPRPEDAIMSDDMRGIVRALAQRCSVCVVSGRDRAVVSELMGVDDLIVAGSHGFDIYDPARGPIVHEASQGWEGLVAEVTERVRAAADDIPGTLVEPKHASVALHDRHVADADRPRVAALVEAVLAEHPGELRVTPGKFVHEIPAEDRLEQGQGRRAPPGRPRPRPPRARWSTQCPDLPRRRRHRRGRLPCARRPRRRRAPGGRRHPRDRPGGRPVPRHVGHRRPGHGRRGRPLPRRPGPMSPTSETIPMITPLPAPGVRRRS